MERVGQCALLLKRGKSCHQVTDVIMQSSGEHATRDNKRVTSPIKEPRVTSNDRFACPTFHNELFERIFKAAGK